MTIARSIATVAALERIVSVLQARYPTALESIADDGLRLIAPGTADYHLPGGYLSSSVFNSPIAVIVQQSDRSRSSDPHSGDSGVWTQRVTMPVSVRVVFSCTAYDPLTRTGREQTHPEHLQHRAERYKGALIEVLQAHARDGESISDLVIRSDFASVTTLDSINGGQGGGLIGGCVLECEIQQFVSIPNAQYS